MKLTEAEAMAKELFQEHNLNLVGWTFQFDKAVRRFGACHHGLKRITLSKALTELNDDKQVRDTLLHEIAHALVGVNHGHDRAWKQMAKLIGAKPVRTYSLVDVKTVDRPRKRYSRKFGTCPRCEKRVSRKQIRNGLACASCCDKYNAGTWDERFVFIWDGTE